MKISISEAARRAGVDRGTLYRRLKEGLISKELGTDGKPVIDLAELVRIYPQAVSATDDNNSYGSSIPQGTTPININGLQVENEMLREVLAELRKDRDSWRGMAERLSLAPPKHDPVMAKERHGLFGLFKRAE